MFLVAGSIVSTDASDSLLVQEGPREKLECRQEMHISGLYKLVDGPGSCDATLSLSAFTTRRRLPYGSRSLSNYVGGCSVSDKDITILEVVACAGEGHAGV